MTSATSGVHGTSSGSICSSRSASATELASGSPSTSTSRRPRRSFRNGKYGVVASYCSQPVVTRVSPSARSQSSSRIRDLPMPASPMSSTKLPKPMRTGTSAASSTGSSRCRSTSGSFFFGEAGSRVPETAPTATASTGSAFPFSVSAPTGSVAKAVRDRSRRSGVVQIERPSAFAIRRAASAAVPPRIVNACR